MSFVMLIRQLQTLPRDGSWLPQIRGLKFSVSPHTSTEKAVAPHSSTLAWKIPWTEEPGRLQSMGSLRVGHNWVTSLSLFTFHFHVLEKEMATHSSVLAWRIPGTGEPGELPSTGSQRVGHNWSDLAVAAATLLKREKELEVESVAKNHLISYAYITKPPWNPKGLDSENFWVGEHEGDLGSDLPLEGIDVLHRSSPLTFHMHLFHLAVCVCSVNSDSLQPHGL